MINIKSAGKLARFVSVLLANVETIYWSKLVKKNVISLPMFDSYEHFVAQLRLGYKPNRNVVVELMCHPGYDKYVKEYQMIKYENLQRYLPEATLISYRNLNVEHL